MGSLLSQPAKVRMDPDDLELLAAKMLSLLPLKNPAEKKKFVGQQGPVTPDQRTPEQIAAELQETIAAGIADSPTEEEKAEVEKEKEKEKEEEKEIQQPALPGDDIDPEAYVRKCQYCGHCSYVRNGVCLNPYCVSWQHLVFFWCFKFSWCSFLCMILAYN